MAGIDITRKHSFAVEDLKSKLDGFRGELKSRFGIDSEWSGNTAKIKGKGIKNGEIAVSEGSIRVQIKLGMLARPFAGSIESKINEKLNEIIPGS